MDSPTLRQVRVSGLDRIKLILEQLDLPMEIMPEIVEPGTVIGKINELLADSVGINPAQIIAVGSHDTASAFASAPISNPDEALIISSGTWSLVGRLIPEPNTSPEAMAVNASNEGGIGNIRFLKNCMGTWLSQELRRAWAIADGEEMAWDDFDNMAYEAPEFGSFIDPDDASFYNPTNMEEAIIAFCEKTSQPVPQNRSELIRLVYESLALKYRMVNEQLGKAAGKETKVVHIVGGGCKNALLNQFTADAVGVPVVAGPQEATAIGNLMVQAMAMGIIDGMQGAQALIKKAFPIKEFQPANVEAWREAYERFKTICS